MMLRQAAVPLSLALLSACPSAPYTPSPTFGKLAPYRRSATASLDYAALHFEAIYGRGPLGLGGLQPVRPVLGLPALVRRGTTLEVEYLTQTSALGKPFFERGMGYRLVRRGQPCPGIHCHILGKVRLMSRRPLPNGAFHIRLEVQLPYELGAGFYDLIHQLNYTAQLRRTPSAVLVVGHAPDAIRPFGFVHLTDPHLGHRGGDRSRRFALVVDWLNRLSPRPAFVVLTGDLTELGPVESHWDEVARQLGRLELPVFVTLGNHDYYRPGLGRVETPRGMAQEEVGLRHFMSSFHPFLAYRFHYGGYRFLAVDTGTGATLRSLWQGKWVTTQGLHPAQLADIRAFLDSPAGSGHVLLGHAPSRARLSPKTRGCEPGMHGVFLVGRRPFERALLASWRRRPRPILYLSGHTHWNDIYVRSADSQCRFEGLPVRHRHMGARPCWRPLPTGRAPWLITTQSATKHNPLRSGGLLQRGMRLGDGAGAGFGFRVFQVRGTRWLTASYRFYHRTGVIARRHSAGYLDPRSDQMIDLPTCGR
ncbi:MAG: metallophosphoesterase [bacterium]